MPSSSPSSDLAGRRLLVTGANGFIGARLCRRAASLGAVVHAVSRRPPDPELADLSWHVADLSDTAATEALVRSVAPDCVAHLASEVSGTRQRSAVLPMFRSNLLSSVNLMLAADAAGCGRVILAGSMEEPDVGTTGAPPVSPYAAAKWASHAYARMFHALYALPVVHLRLFMVYGPGQRDLTKLVPHVIGSLLRDEPPQLASGTRRIDWVYVDDVVEAFVAAITTPAAVGRSFDIGSGHLISVRDLVTQIRRLAGAAVEPVFGAVADRRLEVVRVADPTAARETLSWSPQTSLPTGLARTIEYYRAGL